MGLVRRRFPKIWTYLYPLMELAFETDDEGQIYITPDEPYSWDELRGSKFTSWNVHKNYKR